MPTRPGERHLRYVRPSSMTLGAWDAGADWTSPTATSFEQQVLQAEDYAASVTVSPEVEWTAAPARRGDRAHLWQRRGGARQGGAGRRRE
jgi:hypothetical protein